MINPDKHPDPAITDDDVALRPGATKFETDFDQAVAELHAARDADAVVAGTKR
jgi:hypothetical protein